MPKTDPIQQEHIEVMQGIGEALDEIFNGKSDPDRVLKYGFALLVFDFGEGPDNKINFISNADREDMLVAMKEFIARAEGTFHDNETKH